ncbi:MAG: amine oxidase, partial [Steroidobacteraceae bacterium]
DPGALMLQVEPLIHVCAAPDRPDLIEASATFTAYQWQAWDLLLGRAQPELGGHAGAIDLIGVNHYHDAQWELPSGTALAWNPVHAGRRSVAELLEEAAARYQLPMVIAETSNVGSQRVAWLNMITAQTLQAMAHGVPIQGICLYPIVDRPDWNNGAHWHNSGLWDAGEGVDARLRRTLATAYASELRSSQSRFASRAAA